MINSKHKKLRCALLGLGYDATEASAAIGRKQTYFSIRMNGHKPWTTEEMYTLMDLIEKPYDEMYVYFPRQGGRTK